jgi:hypothetical protein
MPGVIRQRGSSWQVRIYAGKDPASGKPRHLYGTAPTKRAARILEGKLERQAAKVTPATATVDYLLDRWLAVARHAPSNGLRHPEPPQKARTARPRP